MVTQPESLPQYDLLLRNIEELTVIWRIARTDGETVYLTNHSSDITYEGNVYSPVSTGDASAESRAAGLKDKNKTYAGFIDSVLITHDDLMSGKYDGAQMTELIISWRYPWAGALMISVGWLTQPSFDEESWSVEVEGITRFLRDKKGRSYSTTCDYNLGDSKCQKDISSMIIYDATIQTVFTRTNGTQNRTLFEANTTGVASGAALSAVDGYYDFGKIRWTTGSNAGFTSEVKTYAATGNVFEIQRAVPFDIAVSDEFVLQVGCDRRYTTCRDKFDNLLRFGGFPYIPGVHYMIRQPVKAP